ncbi:MAG: FHA domain-containing protein [Nannocystaceae bacterium]
MQVSPRQHLAVTLRVEAGPDRGLEHPLADQPTSIGRGTDSQYRLSDAAVSRHHLTLQAERDAQGRCFARVLAVTATNPAWRLVAGDRSEVAVGDGLGVGSRITLGNTTILVDRGAAAHRHTTPRGTHGVATVEIDARPIPAAGGGSHLAALAALGDLLARCGSPQAVFRRTTEWAVEALTVSRALLLTPDGEDVLAAASSNSIPDLAISRTLFTRVLRSQWAFLVRDTSSDPELAQRRSVQLRGVQGAMVAPAANLVFYVEWDARVETDHDENTLALLVCAAQLVDAMGNNARERQELQVAAPPRPRDRVLLRDSSAAPQPCKRYISSSNASLHHRRPCSS